MPEKFDLPSSITLSRTNVEQILVDDRVVIGGKEKNIFQVCVLNENGNNIFMELKRHSYEKYKLLEFKELRKDGEVLFKWDSLSIDKKSKKLILSRREDLLEDITDMDI